MFLCSILKGSVDSYISVLTKILNISLERDSFLNQLKFGEVIPVFKKEDEQKIIPPLVSIPTHLRYLKK